jgi:hypothetical protein
MTHEGDIKAPTKLFESEPVAIRLVNLLHSALASRSGSL